MVHGIDGFFAERVRFRRRVALLSLAVALGLQGLLWLMRTPPLQEVLAEPERFGFEGPEHYVRRIVLETHAGTGSSSRESPSMVELVTRKGGEPNRRRGPQGVEPARPPRDEGPGEATETLVARALARRADVPLVRSEDLVVEHLVKPAYPEEARTQNIEGRVAVLALVDTTGEVVEVDVTGGSGEPLLERAAVEAVWQCRFRPWRVAGRAREVYALFRFNFTLY
jgi:TonB family protein